MHPICVKCPEVWGARKETTTPQASGQVGVGTRRNVPLAASGATSPHPWPECFHHLLVRALMVQGRQPSEHGRRARSSETQRTQKRLNPAPRTRQQPCEAGRQGGDPITGVRKLRPGKIPQGIRRGVWTPYPTWQRRSKVLLGKRWHPVN